MDEVFFHIWIDLRKVLVKIIIWDFDVGNLNRSCFDVELVLAVKDKRIFSKDVTFVKTKNWKVGMWRFKVSKLYWRKCFGYCATSINYDVDAIWFFVFFDDILSYRSFMLFKNLMSFCQHPVHSIKFFHSGQTIKYKLGNCFKVPS